MLSTIRRKKISALYHPHAPQRHQYSKVPIITLRNSPGNLFSWILVSKACKVGREYIRGVVATEHLVEHLERILTRRCAVVHEMLAPKFLCEGPVPGTTPKAQHLVRIDTR